MDVVFEDNYASGAIVLVQGTQDANLDREEVNGLPFVLRKATAKDSARLIPVQHTCQVFKDRDLSIDKDILGRTRNAIKIVGSFNYISADQIISHPLLKADVGCTF